MTPYLIFYLIKIEIFVSSKIFDKEDLFNYILLNHNLILLVLLSLFFNFFQH